MVDNILDILAYKIKKFREDIGYTQQQVAEFLNIDRSTYAYYESGKTTPDLKTIENLSEIFKIPISELLEKEKKPIIVADCRVSFQKVEVDDLIKRKIPISKWKADQEQEDEPKKNVIPSKFSRSISDLSDKERKIVLCYRLLSTKSQERVLSLVSEKLEERKKTRLQKYDYE